MKNLYTLICFIVINTISYAQGYEFALVHDGGYDFSIIATPSFDATETDVSDIGFALMLPAGDADVVNLSQFSGRAWSATQVTATQLTGLSLGDGTRDGFAMNLPPGQTMLSHTNMTPFILVSFQISNTPTTGLLEILSNTDPIAIGLGGALDSFYNSNIDETTTQNYFEALTTGAENFMFETLELEENTLVNMNISVFPNPTTDFVTIVTAQQIDTVEVYNLLGKLLFIAANKKIEFKPLDSGIYLLKINTQNGTSTKRIVKK